MKKVLVSTIALGIFLVPGTLLIAQQRNQGTAPIYRVTVVERTAKAVNYNYRSGPTLIDFRGTVLLPDAKGTAMVESRKGRTEIDAGFDHLKAPQRFGREYLTYVLWAISPEGRPSNIGELIPGHSDKVRLKVTTDLQAFAMIVTAEPYAAVRQPSDVVVMENFVRGDTSGKVVPVDAKYELLPRGQYTWNVSPELVDTPKVSGREYDTLVELYQAENAVGVAGAAGAAQYAPNTYSKAQQLLQEAQRLHAQKGDSHRVIQDAREASQTAEDARMIAMQRKQNEQAESARAAISQAELEVQRARTEAEAERQRADAERAARTAAEAQAAQAQALAAQAEAAGRQANVAAARAQQQLAQTQAQTQVSSAPPNPTAVQASAASQAAATRSRLLEEMNGVVLVRDTPRGLVVTFPDTDFTGETAGSAAAARVARLAAIVARYPGLHVSCEGYTDAPASDVLSQRRADAMRTVLLGNGLRAEIVTARGFGNSRPLASSATAEGRLENTRVEIVISGDPIGTVPFWDRTYPLKSGGE